MKNSELFVSGPLLAAARMPALVNCRLEVISSSHFWAEAPELRTPCTTMKLVEGSLATR